MTNVTEEAALSKLQAAYRNSGLEVRFYPDCISVMRWQVLGRNGDDGYIALLAMTAYCIKAMMTG